MTAPGSLHDVARLYTEHHPWLIGWLRRKLGCPHHAADMAHDTFARILAALDKGVLAEAGALRQPRAFLTTTATRLIVDAARRREIERAYLETLAVVQPREASMPSPEQMLELLETLHAIAALLDGLADKPRRAFLMYRLDGLSQPEIARELGVSASMVKQYVAQAMVHCYAVQHGLPP
jgi:RNA polymerase sigma-19 factor, ECF subfamily